jgi:hypothetical protein
MNPIPPSFSIPASFNPSSLGFPSSPTAGVSSQLNDDNTFLNAVSQAMDSNLISADIKWQVTTALFNSDLASLSLDERAAIVQGAAMIGGPNMTDVQRSNQANAVVALIARSSSNQGSGSVPSPAPTTPTPTWPAFAAPATTLPPTFAAPAPFVPATLAPAAPAAPASTGPGQTLSNGLFVSDASLASSDHFATLVQQTLRQSGMLPINNLSGGGGANLNAVVVQALMMIDTSTLSPQERFALLEQISEAASDQNLSLDELNSIFANAGPQPLHVMST